MEDNTKYALKNPKKNPKSNGNEFKMRNNNSISISNELTNK